MSDANHVSSSPSQLTTPVMGTMNLSSQPHLVSLVLQSKKALQHGEFLCTKAHSASNASAQASVDVLALDAKVRWIVEAVVEQLQLAANVAKTIEEKRAQLLRQVNEWDTERTRHGDALDDILESLGAQVVPPDFHQQSSDSSLFGSQHSADLEEELTKSKSHDSVSPGTSPNGQKYGPDSSTLRNHRASTSPVSPSATIRRNGSLRKNDNLAQSQAQLKGKIKHVNGSTEGRHRKKEDRKHWKTLRDFVDDQAIENVLETVENDRSALDYVLGKTDDYPEILGRTIQAIRAQLPFPDVSNAESLKRIQDIIVEQENIAHSMAELLESLAGHYDGMESALKDIENGETFTEEELQIMNRDTEELHAIMNEMQQSAETIESYQGKLVARKEVLEKDLEHLSSVLDDLDELGDIMAEMLQTQETVEVQVSEELRHLYDHLDALQNTFHTPYVKYRTAFTKLLLEMERRRKYKESAESIVREENHVRERFNVEYGDSLPLDLCLYVANSPTRWEIVPCEGSAPEIIPSIDSDLIAHARERMGQLGAENL
ncbi:hypothetical protein D9613_007894 [Agrocybe pediades]|uniref:Autophagy-related protein 17 n=1 Tax=Agrocybe pediades TaxID=84607 RepID=A0A8H4QM03_9AGAR|nr:hypothetical protein D9613_007894 [Agrocybe pediades]